MHQLNFAAGDTIFNPGDVATTAYMIREGAVRLDRAIEDRGAVELHAGEVFSEMSLIDEKAHPETAVALTEVRLECVTRSEFDRMLTADPVGARPFLNALFKRLKVLSSQLESVHEKALVADHGIRVTIHPTTRRAAATLPMEGLSIDHFPFRVGRAAGSNEEIPQDMNDLWLVDHTPFSVSRTHVSIEREGDQVVVKDRGSYLGTIVNDFPIGAKCTSRKATLDDGNNTVILGGRMSRYQFRIHVERDAAAV